MDALQRSLISQAQKHPQAQSPEPPFANYDALSQKHTVQAHNMMFILPEFQQFQHIFKRNDPQIWQASTDDSLTQGALMLEQAYNQCLRRLDNALG